MNEILVFARHLFADLPAEGAWLITGLPRQGQWRPRAVVEQDERWLQPIPYLLITDEQNRFWCYRRSGGDRRLADRFSCGVGGHVERIDQREELADTLAGALRRELAEELRQGVGLDPGPPLGWLYRRTLRHRPGAHRCDPSHPLAIRGRTTTGAGRGAGVARLSAGRADSR